MADGKRSQLYSRASAPLVLGLFLAWDFYSPDTWSECQRTGIKYGKDRRKVCGGYGRLQLIAISIESINVPLEQPRVTSWPSYLLIITCYYVMIKVKKLTGLKLGVRTTW